MNCDDSSPAAHEVLRPISWAQYKSLPADARKEYYRKLKVRFNAYDRMIAEMMGITRSPFELFNRQHGITTIKIPGCVEPDMKGWKLFMAEKLTGLYPTGQDGSCSRSDASGELSAPVKMENGHPVFHVTEKEYYKLIDDNRRLREENMALQKTIDELASKLDKAELLALREQMQLVNTFLERMVVYREES